MLQVSCPPSVSLVGRRTFRRRLILASSIATALSAAWAGTSARGQATGVFSTSGLLPATDQTTQLGLDPSKTYVEAIDLGDTGSTTVNGVTFTGTAATAPTGIGSQPGTTWSLTGTASLYTTAGVTPAGDIGLLTRNFIYGGNPAILTLGGLTVGQTYSVAFYDRTFQAGSGLRFQNFTAAGASSATALIDEDAGATAQGQLSVIRYTFQASTATQTLTVAPVQAGNTFHFYDFATEQTFNNTYLGGPDYSTALFSNGATGGAVNGPNGAGSNASFPAASGAAAVNLDVSETLGHLQFDGTSPYTFSSSNGSTLTLQADVGAVSVLSTLAGTHTVSTAVQLNSDAMKSGAGTLVLSGTVSGGKGLIVSGGVLNLQATETYTGATTASAGRLLLGPGGSLGATPVTVTSGGTFGVSQTSSGASNSVGAATFTVNAGGALNMRDGFASTLNLGGAAVLNGAVLLDLGATTAATDKIVVVGGVTGGGTLGFASTALAPGSYPVLSGASGLGPAAFTLTSGTITVGGSTYGLSLANSTATSEVLTVSAPGVPTAYWTGLRGSVWNAVSGGLTNFNTDATSGINTGAQPSAATDVFFSTTNPVPVNLTNTLGQDYSINSLTFLGNSGAVTIGAGNTLTLNGPAGLSVASGSAAQTINAGLALGGNQIWTNNSANLLSLGGVVALGPYTLTTAGSGSIIYNNVLNGAGGLASGGTGPVTLGAANNYTGATTVNVASTLSATATGGLGVSTITTNNGTLILSGGNGTLGTAGNTAASTLLNNGVLQLQANAANTSGGVSTAFTALANSNTTLSTTGTAQTIQLRGDSNVTFASGGTPGGTGLTGAGSIGGINNTAGYTLNLDVNRLTTGGNNVFTFASNNGLQIGRNVTVNVTGGNGDSLVLGNLSYVTTPGVVTLVPTTANLSIAGFLSNQATAATLTLDGTSANNVVTGPITNGTSAGTVVNKTNTSTWTLQGANTYTGGTVLSNGTLNLNTATALGGAAGAFALNGGAINNTSGAAIALTNANPISFGGNFAFGTAASTAVSNLTFPGAVTNAVSGRVITLNGVGTTLAFTGLLTNTLVGANTVTVNGAGNTAVFGSYNLANLAVAYQDIFNGTGNVSIPGVVANGGTATGSGLTYSGTGKLTLGGANTFTGVLDISNGIVNVATLTDYGVAGGLGARAAASETSVGDGIGIHLGVGTTGATLQYTGATPQSTNRQIRISATTNTIDASGSVPAATVAFTYSGSNTNLYDTGGARTLNLTGSNAGNNLFSITLTDQATTGLTSLTKSGAGTWALNSNENFSGATNINSGVLVLGNGANFNASNVTATATTSININAGGTLAIRPGLVANTSGQLGLDGANNSLGVTGSTTTGGALTFAANSAFTMADGIASNFFTSGAANLYASPFGGVAPSFTFDISATNGLSDKLAIGGAVTSTDPGARIFISALGAPTVGNSYTLITAGSGTGLTTNGPTLGNATVVVGGVAYGLALNNSATSSVLTVTGSGIASAYYTGAAGGALNNLVGGTTSNFAANAAGTTDLAPAAPTSFTDVYFTAASVPGGTPVAITSLGANTTYNSLNFTANSPAVTLSDSGGNTLTLNNGGINVASGSPAQQINLPVVLGGTQTWTNNSANRLTIGGTVTAGANALIIAGSGAVTISGNYVSTGFLTSAGGGLTLGGAANTARGLFLNSTNPVDIGSGTLTLNNAGAESLNSTVGGTVNATGGGVLVLGFAGDNWGTANGTTLTLNAKVSGPAANAFESYPGVANGTGVLVLANNANDFAGVVNINAGVLSVGTIGSVGSPSGLGQGNTISFGSGTTTGTLLYTGSGATTDRVVNLSGTTAGGTISASGTGLLRFSSNLTATGAGAKTLTLTGTGLGEFAGVIVNSSAATGVTKAGTGTWTLSGANTYTGTTTVSAGTLNLNNTAALGTGPLALAGGSIDNTTGAAETLTTNNAVNFTANSTNGIFRTGATATSNLNLGIGAVALNIAAAGTDVLNLNGTGTTLTLGGIVTGQTNIAGAGTLTVNGPGNTLVLGSLVTNTATTAQAFTIGGTGNVVISGTISGGTTAEVLNKAGTGTLTLNGVGNYSGGTNIGLNAGFIAITNAAALGTGTVTNSAGNSASSPSTVQFVFTVPATGTGSSAVNPNVIVNTFNLSSETLLNATISAGLPGFADIQNISGFNRISGPINLANTGGTGAVITSESGNLELAGGLTATLSGGGTRPFDLGGAGNGVVTGNINDGTAAVPTLVAIQKDGTGTWTIAGGNTYTGPTTVNAGTLNISGSLTGTTGVVITGSGTLLLTGGSESINNAASLSLGGSATPSFLRLGSTAQMETLGPLTLTLNGALDFGGTTGDASSTVSANTLLFSSLTSVSGAGLSVLHWTGPVSETADAGTGSQDRLLFSSATSLSALDALAGQLAFFGDNGTALGAGHAIAYTGPGGGYEIVPIPEPSSVATLILTAGLFGLRRRRKQSTV